MKDFLIYPCVLLPMLLVTGFALAVIIKDIKKQKLSLRIFMKGIIIVSPVFIMSIGIDLLELGLTNSNDITTTIGILFIPFFLYLIDYDYNKFIKYLYKNEEKYEKVAVLRFKNVKKSEKLLSALLFSAVLVVLALLIYDIANSEEIRKQVISIYLCSTILYFLIRTFKKEHPNYNDEIIKNIYEDE